MTTVIYESLEEFLQTTYLAKDEEWVNPGAHARGVFARLQLDGRMWTIRNDTKVGRLRDLAKVMRDDPASIRERATTSVEAIDDGHIDGLYIYGKAAAS